MGITKKAVLASLVSVMMSLAFLIGLVPTHNASDVTAASDGNGRVDMVDLLNAVLNLKAAATSVSVTEPPTGTVFVIPTNSFLANINVGAEALDAGSLPGDAGPIIFGADGATVSEGDWLGSVYSGPVLMAAYLYGSLDISDLIQRGLTGTDTALAAHQVYAFGFASMEKVAEAHVMYDPLVWGEEEFSVTTVGPDFSPMGNGLFDRGLRPFYRAKSGCPRIPMAP